jgi:hypothetical protein
MYSPAAIVARAPPTLDRRPGNRDRHSAVQAVQDDLDALVVGPVDRVDGRLGLGGRSGQLRVVGARENPPPLPDLEANQLPEEQTTALAISRDRSTTAPRSTSAAATRW